MKHVLNSAGIQRFGDYQFDMVRLGVGLHGIGVGEKHKKHLQEICVLKSRVSQVSKVKKGDSLYKISRIYNVKINAIKKVNGLSKDIIYINQKIKIPSEFTNIEKESIVINKVKYYINKKQITFNHIVKRYDNWYKIAKKYDVSLKDLLQWNDANKKTILKVNDLVKINLRGPILNKEKSINTLRYVVSSGERYEQIIRGFGISKKNLIKDNNLKNKKYLTAGDNLEINLN